MRRTRFEAIVRVLGDGAWHTRDDLEEAASDPNVLRAEGLVETTEHLGDMLVPRRPNEQCREEVSPFGG